MNTYFNLALHQRASEQSKVWQSQKSSVLWLPIYEGFKFFECICDTSRKTYTLLKNVVALCLAKTLPASYGMQAWEQSLPASEPCKILKGAAKTAALAILFFIIVPALLITPYYTLRIHQWLGLVSTYDLWTSKETDKAIKAGLSPEDKALFIVQNSLHDLLMLLFRAIEEKDVELFQAGFDLFPNPKRLLSPLALNALFQEKNIDSSFEIDDIWTFYSDKFNNSPESDDLRQGLVNYYSLAIDKLHVPLDMFLDVLKEADWREIGKANPKLIKNLISDQSLSEYQWKKLFTFFDLPHDIENLDKAIKKGISDIEGHLLLLREMANNLRKEFLGKIKDDPNNWKSILESTLGSDYDESILNAIKKESPSKYEKLTITRTVLANWKQIVVESSKRMHYLSAGDLQRIFLQENFLPSIKLILLRAIANKDSQLFTSTLLSFKKIYEENLLVTVVIEDLFAQKELGDDLELRKILNKCYSILGYEGFLCSCHNDISNLSLPMQVVYEAIKDNQAEVDDLKKNLKQRYTPTLFPLMQEIFKSSDWEEFAVKHQRFIFWDIDNLKIVLNDSVLKTCLNAFYIQEIVLGILGDDVFYYRNETEKKLAFLYENMNPINKLLFQEALQKYWILFLILSPELISLILSDFTEDNWTSFMRDLAKNHAFIKKAFEKKILEIFIRCDEKAVLELQKKDVFLTPKVFFKKHKFLSMVHNKNPELVKALVSDMFKATGLELISEEFPKPTLESLKFLCSFDKAAFNILINGSCPNDPFNRSYIYADDVIEFVIRKSYQENSLYEAIDFLIENSDPSFSYTLAYNIVTGIDSCLKRELGNQEKYIELLHKLDRSKLKNLIDLCLVKKKNKPLLIDSGCKNFINAYLFSYLVFGPFKDKIHSTLPIWEILDAATISLEEKKKQSLEAYITDINQKPIPIFFADALRDTTIEILNDKEKSSELAKMLDYNIEGMYVSEQIFLIGCIIREPKVISWLHRQVDSRKVDYQDLQRYFEKYNNKFPEFFDASLRNLLGIEDRLDRLSDIAIKFE